MPNGRCRLPGGLSTGPKTLEGIERIRQAVTKHGRYSKRARVERQQYRKLLQHWREMLSAMSGNDNEPCFEAGNEANGQTQSPAQ
jgi:hypothetical protein